MKELPGYVQEKLQPRLKVIWAGRRAIYEVVEEVSNGVFWLWIIAGIAYNVDIYVMDFRNDVDRLVYWVGVAVIGLLAAQHAILEIMAWQNEIYVVARDEVNGGGRIYKFWGWLSKRYIDEAITSGSPTILPEAHWYFRLWGALTGEKMVKVKLASMNNVYLEGKKISPDFERAIKFVRGYKAPKEELPATSLANLSYLDEARIRGTVKDHKFLEDAAKKLIQTNIYGE